MMGVDMPLTIFLFIYLTNSKGYLIVCQGWAEKEVTYSYS